MELRYTVHLDDYHSNIIAPGFRTKTGAAMQVLGEINNGYDVDRITLDGAPFKVTQCSGTMADGEPCDAPAASWDGKDLCYTHIDQADYNRHSRAGRYQGD